MAKDKKSVLIYCDLIHTVEHLPDELAGKLFKHFLAYVNDRNPETDDVMLKIAFEPIKQQLKRDLQKYNNIVERNRANGAKGGRPKKPTGLSGNPKKPKKPDTDTDTDNGNGNGNGRDTKELRTKKRFVRPTKEELIDFFKEKGLVEYRANEKAEAFINYYTSNGWKVGKNPMKSWQAAAGGIWMKDENQANTNNNPLHLGEQNYNEE